MAYEMFGSARPKRTMAKKFMRKLKDKAKPSRGKLKTLKTKKLGTFKKK